MLGIVAGNNTQAYIILASGCAVFLYVSYVMPIGAGLLAEGKTWTKKGPFHLGGASKLVAVLAIIGGLILAFVGFQPPYSWWATSSPRWWSCWSWSGSLSRRSASLVRR